MAGHVMAGNLTMNCALSAAAEPELELAALLAAAQQDEFGAIELFRHRTSSCVVRDNLSVRDIRNALAASQVKLAAYEIRPLTGRKADSDERNLPYNLRQLEWDTHLGRALGIQTISVRSGTTSSQEQAQEARADLVEGLGQLVERIPDVTFAVGPAVDSVLQTAADFDELLSGIDGVGVILDVAPLRAAAVDLAAFARDWAQQVSLVRLDDGDVPVDEIADALTAADFNGPIVLESRDADLRQRVQTRFG